MSRFKCTCGKISFVLGYILVDGKIQKIYTCGACKRTFTENVVNKEFEDDSEMQKAASVLFGDNND